jgi:hypothetical protein
MIFAHPLFCSLLLAQDMSVSIVVACSCDAQMQIMCFLKSVALSFFIS